MNIHFQLMYIIKIDVGHWSEASDEAARQVLCPVLITPTGESLCQYTEYGIK